MPLIFCAWPIPYIYQGSSCILAFPEGWGRNPWSCHLCQEATWDRWGVQCTVHSFPVLLVLFLRSVNTGWPRDWQWRQARWSYICFHICARAKGWLTRCNYCTLPPPPQLVEPSEIVAWARERGKVLIKCIISFFLTFFSRCLIWSWSSLTHAPLSRQGWRKSW